MPAVAVQGLAETYALFDRIPQSADEQLTRLVVDIGLDVLGAQQRDVAKRTGTLASGLSIQADPGQHRARVGLLGTTGRSKYYYGRFVEFGRRAQTVIVQRRRRTGGKLRLNRSRRKMAEDIAATYSMHVSPLAPRPFVHVDRPEIRTEQRLAAFWGKVKAGAGANS
jgi:hypothetical protein